MEFTEEIQTKIRTAIEATDFGSNQCKNLVQHFISVHVRSEFLDAYCSHLKDGSIPASERCKTVSDLMKRITQGDGDMTTHLITRAMEKCVKQVKSLPEAQKTEDMSVGEGHTEIAAPSERPHALELIVQLLSSPGGAAIFITLVLVGLLLGGLITQAQIVEFGKFFWQ